MMRRWTDLSRGDGTVHIVLIGGGRGAGRP